MLKHTLFLLPFLIAAAAPVAKQDEDAAGAQDQLPASARALTVERGEGLLPFVIPADERLKFDVVLDMGVLGETRVGTFTMTAGTEPFRKGLPRAGSAAGPEKRAGWLLSEGKGRYLGYTLDHTTETRILPQLWPWLIHRDTQKGSENRRRELMYGTRDKLSAAWYRSDTHCGGCDRPEHVVEGSLFSSAHHCTKCKRGEHRIWKKPRMLESIPGALDTQISFHLARALVLSDDTELTFPLLDRKRHWLVTFIEGELKTIKTPAGRFRCREIKMIAEPSSDSEEETQFKGLFGMHGSLSLWLDQRTGVLVRITGMLPLGPIDLDVSIELAEFDGTPKGFGPIKSSK